ncbi:hypothetical protein Pa4123_14800 [Phytohabitans aurantiacus]|uniref:Uncharacterized protein n=1 Tax=Phytohabitans aurantiacus TaxID=3016789 RepID=A0ABQ5QQQ6_9ACTN|nr:hypothetical protein Pa4123_14800 [Phytohabitans aurantiacus]
MAAAPLIWPQPAPAFTLPSGKSIRILVPGTSARGWPFSVTDTDRNVRCQTVESGQAAAPPEPAIVADRMMLINFDIQS